MAYSFFDDAGVPAFPPTFDGAVEQTVKFWVLRQPEFCKREAVMEDLDRRDATWCELCMSPQYFEAAKGLADHLRLAAKNRIADLAPFLKAVVAADVSLMEALANFVAAREKLLTPDGTNVQPVVYHIAGPKPHPFLGDVQGSEFRGAVPFHDASIAIGSPQDAKVFVRDSRGLAYLVDSTTYQVALLNQSLRDIAFAYSTDASVLGAPAGAPSAPLQHRLDAVGAESSGAQCVSPPLAAPSGSGSLRRLDPAAFDSPAPSTVGLGMNTTTRLQPNVDARSRRGAEVLPATPARAAEPAAGSVSLRSFKRIRIEPSTSQLSAYVDKMMGDLEAYRGTGFPRPRSYNGCVGVKGGGQLTVDGVTVRLGTMSPVCACFLTEPSTLVTSQ